MASRKFKYALFLIIFLVVIQLIPVPKDNPPISSPLQVSAQVDMVLRRSCYDCHSHETSWPWYSRIAPISWLVAWDVIEGRDHLNFSIWGEYPANRQAKLFREIRETVDEGEMPPLQYLPTHPDAGLSEAEKNLIRNWTLSQ